MVQGLTLLAAAFLCAVNAAAPRQYIENWDYWPPLPVHPQFPGVFVSSRPGQNGLKPQSFDPIDLFDLHSDRPSTNVLLYGSVLLHPTILNTDEAPANTAVISAFNFAKQAIRANRQLVDLSPVAVLHHAVMLPLSVTGDNGQSEMVVLHQYGTERREMVQFKSHVTFGINFYLTIDDPSFRFRHRVVVSLDREGAHNLFHHTFHPQDSTMDTKQSCASEEGLCSPPRNPRILSYNVWNTNPSADVYGATRRWPHYVKRIDHLVDFVKQTNADIIGFQEVRFDGVFGDRGDHAQVQHLASRLPGYQYAYQAAMSYLNDRSPFERIEEGPAIFSKHPIVHTDYLLLSRDPNDPNDSHQRLCLHSVVDHPTWGQIDVYVTHLSLSEWNREKTMVEIWEYMKQGKGVTQVLLGDLNAEPQSRGIKFLRGAATLNGVTTDLKDAWLAKHTEAEPRSKNANDQKSKFTFPSDAPSKRIDFILYRGKGNVKECAIMGQEPTPDTVTFPKDIGMLNLRSPVYASDHRGVVAEFEA